MERPVYNLRNHTPFSSGAYTIDELCEAHLALKTVAVDGVGISDDLFCTPSSREVRDARGFERLFARETRDYVEQVHAARRRWSGKLSVFCGATIDWQLNRSHLDSIRTLLNGIDYVLFINVDWAALTQIAHQARKWPCPVGLAAVDVGDRFPNTSMDQVVRTLANARIFYEIDVRQLPITDFDRWFAILPRHKVRVALGTDTHDELDCLQDLVDLVAVVKRFGLEDKLVTPQRRDAEVMQPSRAV